MAPFNVAHSTHIQIDDSPTQGSDNLVTSGALHTALATKESVLTFANNALETVTGGSIARGDGTNIVTFTPPTLNKTAVGLGNCDNTSDASKPVSSAQQSALNLKANLASPTFTGIVTLPSTRFHAGVLEVGHRADLGASSGNVTMKTVTITDTDNHWNLCLIAIEYAVMQDAFGLPYGAGKSISFMHHLNNGSPIAATAFASQFGEGNVTNLGFAIGTITHTGGNDWSFPIYVSNSNAGGGLSIACKITLMTTSGTLTVA